MIIAFQVSGEHSSPPPPHTHTQTHIHAYDNSFNPVYVHYRQVVHKKQQQPYICFVVVSYCMAAIVLVILVIQHFRRVPHGNPDAFLTNAMRHICSHREVE